MTNIPRSKGNQTMKFGQFNRNIKLEKSCKKCGRVATPRHFSTHISGSIV